MATEAAASMVFLLVFGLVGGWILAGSMLSPLARISDATRLATNGSLSHRIRLPGRRDEFRELSDAFDVTRTTRSSTTCPREASCGSTPAPAPASAPRP
ncbi:hypothetical protein GCM10009801_74100 [Streptomyces albiaxialis]|uniref:HAMP domain-containing protein n=1 Tax=Streptomyces albiaxialis TaxID=329523 RepID=A0ABN2WXR5_9ACTN